jgi:hypothetical protein
MAIIDKIHSAGWHVVTTKSENGRINYYHIFDDYFVPVYCGTYREVKAFLSGYKKGMEDNERLGK